METISESLEYIFGRFSSNNPSAHSRVLLFALGDTRIAIRGRCLIWRRNFETNSLGSKEAMIQQSSDRAQLYLDIAEVILLALDLHGRITMINQKGCSIVGWEQRELLGRDWIDTCLPDRFRGPIRMSFHNLVAGDLSYIENPVLCKSGEERLIAWRNSLLRDSAGHVVGTLSSGLDITERKRAEEQLAQLSGRIQQLQEEERRRVARDLHDCTAQDLVVLITNLSQIALAMPPALRTLRKLVAHCQTSANKCLREVRTLAYLLHPPMLDEKGLAEAIRDFAKGFAQRTGIGVDVHVHSVLPRLRKDVELALFRVVQESLTNVQRHSESNHVKIFIRVRSGTVTLEISDAARRALGKRRAKVRKTPFNTGVGISSMRERMKLVGGHLEISSGPGGATVCAIVSAFSSGFAAVTES